MFKDKNFDVSFTLAPAMFETLISRSLGIPAIQWFTYFPDPIITFVSRYPFDFSHTLPTLHPNE